MIIKGIVFSYNTPTQKDILWIKATDSNINELYIYDGGWRKIGTSSGGGTSDYNDLANKPRINNVVLEGNLTLRELGIILPDLTNYVTTEALDEALLDYAKKNEIPSVEGLLSKVEADTLYQSKGDYALKSDIPSTDTFATKNELLDYAKKTEIPDVSSFITEEDVDTKLADYATKSEIPDTSNLASKEEVSNAISSQAFKTINGQEITGEGNIEIEGSSITVDEELSETSTNPVQNKTITEELASMQELLMKLDEKVFPTTLTVSGGGTFDSGTTQVITVTWALKKDGQTLTPDSVTVNGESVDPSVGYKVFTNVTTTTTYSVSVVYNGKTYTGSTTATFKVTYYRYYGAMPLSVSIDNITASDITSLTKEVCTAAGASNLSFPIPDEGRLTYAYPTRFGTLTQVQDVNAGGAPSTDWSTNGDSLTPNPRATLSIDGESYYVYCSINPNYEGTFKLSFIK